MKFTCPHCQQPLEADDSFAGATADCPVCGKSFVIEADPPIEPPQPPPPPQPDEQPQPDALSEPQAQPVPPAEPPVPESAPEPIAPPEPEIASVLPPPPPPPPKATPTFRVVSKPATPASSPKPDPSAPPPPPKTAPKCRVVSHSSTQSTTEDTPSAEPGKGIDIENKVRKSVANLHERFNDFAGLEKLEGFSLTALFSDIFGKHKAEDIEEFFTVGTPRATPPIEEVDTSWPRPWLFFRALAASIILYLLFNGGYDYFNNPNLIPGMMLMGTLAVPFSTLLFFYEVNVRRNISLYQVLRLFFLGGILSLLIALVFFKMPGKSDSEILMLSLAGPIEETGKLLALVALARSVRYHYKLNGLLMGAAVGTGFAVFESMGYALRYLINGEIAGFVQEALAGTRTVSSVETMQDVILIRGVLSPLGHIVWTAIAGAALWRVKGTQPFRFSMFGNGKFWHLFLIPVVLHSLWDIPIPPLDNLPFCGKQLLLGFVAWFIVLALVQEGLKELRAEKVASLEAQEQN